MSVTTGVESMHTMGRRARESLFISIFLLPTAITLTVVIFWPLAQGIINAFRKVSLINPELGMPFVGLNNFSLILHDDVFWTAVLNTMTFTSASVVISLLLGITLALLLNQDIRFRGFFRGMALLPWVVPSVITGLIWRWLYHPEWGLLNHILVSLGIIAKSRPWLADPSTAMAAVIVAKIWRTTPFMMVMLLAGLQTIQPELYEAARSDGASAWQEFRYITLPGLQHTIMVISLLSALWSFQAMSLIWVMTEGGPIVATETLAVYVYRTAFQYWKMGYGSALGVILLVFCTVLAVWYVRVLRRS